LPHRYPFLLVDKIIDFTENTIVGIKNVTINEPFFQGHFPGKPVMPGVLIIEAMAQASAVLVVQTVGDEIAGKLVYFMSIEEARFRKPVVPGDSLHIRATVLRNRKNVWKFACEALVEGEKVAEATISAMIMDS
ncbi:MAG: 3-hydroxyacyl-ACP dehydratase FabZ, partial [Rickettsiales bacterium]|nr:3-hydroxyacyl-ACP dehydratase FabZ [Rickettsiales bacterium]